MVISKSTSNAINYLKGIAIVLVLVGHYINRFIGGDYWGYANGMMAFFFLISGYLTFFSIKERINTGLTHFEQIRARFLSRMNNLRA